MRSSPGPGGTAGPSVGRVVGWLVLGVACGLAAGFLAGLARPRVNQQTVGPMGSPDPDETAP